MPKVDVNKKRGYEASVPVEKIWSKLENGMIDKNFCIPLGERKSKNDEYTNLDKAFHILAAGNVLSGFGMFRRVALATLLKYNKPEDLKFILIDPLKISFFHFKNIDKYLVFPIITENKKAINALEWAKEEMERRYEILTKNKIKNIQRYNEKNPDKKIPKIVIMITELGELMDFNAKTTEDSIVRTAQMAKAVGIHFIITTQRVTENTVTEPIKNNMPIKLAFQMSKEASELFIDVSWADGLLGQGDMFMNNFGLMFRMQGYCLEEEEIEKIIF